MQFFSVYLQRPKTAKKALRGVVSITKGVAMLFDDEDRLLVELHKPEVDHMSSEGIFFRGFQPNGSDRRGTPRFLFQEWWCLFDKSGKIDATQF